MKKSSRIVAFAAALMVASLFLTGCLSTSSGSSKTSSSSSSSSTRSSSGTLAVNLYDNCPENTYALAAELALQATMKGYKGVTKLNMSVPPSTADAETVLKYYGYCTGIKTAIEKGTGKTVSLTFNTKKDGKGTALDFTDLTSAAKSLLILSLSNDSSVYAIYRF